MVVDLEFCAIRESPHSLIACSTVGELCDLPLRNLSAEALAEFDYFIKAIHSLPPRAHPSCSDSLVDSKGIHGRVCKTVPEQRTFSAERKVGLSEGHKATAMPALVDAIEILSLHSAAF